MFHPMLLCCFRSCIIFWDFFRYLATASSDHTVKIWNVDGFKLERTLVGNVQNESSLQFTQHSILDSPRVPSDILKLFGQSTLSGHQRWVWDCVFSIDGAYLITGTKCGLPRPVFPTTTSYQS